MKEDNEFRYWLIQTDPELPNTEYAGINVTQAQSHQSTGADFQDLILLAGDIGQSRLGFRAGGPIKRRQ